MELTVNQIKEKQKELEIELTSILNKFNKETELKVSGEIKFGYTEEIMQQWVSLKYSNPFEN